MSQNPNEHMSFTNLLSSNPYAGSSNPSTPSSYNSNSPSPQIPPYGTQLPPEAIYQNQQFAFQNFGNYPQRPGGMQPLLFNPSQPSSFPTPPCEPQFKAPVDRQVPKGRGKKTMAKKSKKVVNLDNDDDDDLEIVGQGSRRIWDKEEEKLLAELWIAVSQDKQLGNDRSDDFFWNQITETFNDQTNHEARTKNMLTGKWTRLNGDCQKFNDVYKHVNRRSGQNDNDHLEAAKENFEQRFGGRRFTYVHAWEVLKQYPKWDAEDPIDMTCLDDIFGPDRRPRPEGSHKARASKKQKSTSTSSAASSGGSQTSSYSGYLSENFSQKAEVQMAAYEARREKDRRLMEMEEMRFLAFDPKISDPEALDIIRRRQKEIKERVRRNNQEQENED